MTDDLTALLRAVIESPDDDHVRLVYAESRWPGLGMFVQPEAVVDVVKTVYGSKDDQ